MDVCKQIDTIRAMIFSDRFIDLVEEHGGPFNGFLALRQPEPRIMTTATINLRKIGSDMSGNHSYPLNISIGFKADRCRLSRGNNVEADIECDFNIIFMRLYDSIIQNYNLDNIKIFTQSVGNNVISPKNEVFSM